MEFLQDLVECFHSVKDYQNKYPNQDFETYHFDAYVNPKSKLLEDEFSTNLSQEELTQILQQHPEIIDISYTLEKKKYKEHLTLDQSKLLLNKKFKVLWDKGEIYNPQNKTEDNMLAEMSVHFKDLYDEYKIRVDYIYKIDSWESKKYLQNLIIKDRCMTLKRIDELDFPAQNKDELLKSLFNDNKYDFKDFYKYNWKSQQNTFFWSWLNRIENDSGFRTIFRDPTDIKNYFIAVKKHELMLASNNEPVEPNQRKFIGNVQKLRSKPDNYLVGLILNDVLNSANIKTWTRVNR